MSGAAAEPEAPAPVALVLTAAELLELRTLVEREYSAAANAHLFLRWPERDLPRWREREAFLAPLVAKLRAAEARVGGSRGAFDRGSPQMSGYLEATHAAAKHVVACFVQLGRCGDEFGWDADGQAACGEYRDALDAAIIKLAEAAHLCHRCARPVPMQQVPPALCEDCRHELAARRSWPEAAAGSPPAGEVA